MVLDGVWVSILVGGVCGIISGLGIGGGSLLMVWLTALLAIEQRGAQGINLLYFLPTAAASLFFHIKNRLVRWDLALPAALAGCLSALAAALIAQHLDVSLLRRLFGGFLVVIGLLEIKKGKKNAS